MLYKFFIFIFALAYSLHAQSLDTNFLYQGGSILVIGNSNTQIGHINSGIEDKLKNAFGFFGHGFLPFHFQTNYRPIPSGVSWTLSNGWSRQDMLESSNDVAEATYYAPSGLWINTDNPEERVTISFNYSEAVGFQLLYLGDVKDGQFDIHLNDTKISTINIRDSVRQTNSFTIPDIEAGDNKITIIVKSGEVHLFGFQIKHQLSSENKFSVVHNWGNGWSTSRDWSNIDSLTLVSGIQALNPDIVLILLGTNDHLRNISTPAQLKANIIKVINRVKAARPGGRILLMSTTGCGQGCDGADLLTEYARTSLPEAAIETAVEYWDLYQWFGIDHGVHFSATEGRSIADELWKVINEKFRTPLTLGLAHKKELGFSSGERFLFFNGPWVFPLGKTRATVYDVSGVLRKVVNIKDAKGVRTENFLPGYVIFEE